MAEDSKRWDLLIIGAGVIGLAIGWQAARAGMGVRVLDKGRAGGGASQAAAGMLAARVEGIGAHRHLGDLLIRSRDLWPDFARAVEKASGIDIGYRSKGTLLTAFDRDQREELETEFPREGDLGHLSPEAAYRLESALAPGLLTAVLSAGDHSVDPRKLVQALKEALVRAGGACLENHRVDEILVEDGRQRGVRVDGRVLRADTIVLAAGAWSAKIPRLRRSRLGGIRPVKGQVIALSMPEAPLITRAVWGYGCYLVPHDGGRLLIGSTLEEMGFDTRVTAQGIHFLLDRARRVLPGIDPCALDDVWSGVRPASDDGLPLLGPLSPRDCKGVIVATGHYRNGILLAPLTARIILDCLRGVPMDSSDRAAAAARFAAGDGVVRGRAGR